MINQEFELEVYDEIISMYERSIGIDLRADPMIYHKVIDLMNMMKSEYGDDPTRLREVITNAIILLLTLFFDKKPPDDFDENDEMKLSALDRDTIKAVLSDALNGVS